MVELKHAHTPDLPFGISLTLTAGLLSLSDSLSVRFVFSAHRSHRITVLLNHLHKSDAQKLHPERDINTAPTAGRVFNKI